MANGQDIGRARYDDFGHQRVLRSPGSRAIAIRDLSTILEGIADALAFSRTRATVVEQ